MRLDIVLIFGLTNHVSSQNLQPLRETGKISNCGKIRDHIASANFEQMHDILNYPEANYLAKHTRRKGKGSVTITCNKMKKSAKKKQPADLAAYKFWLKSINKKSRAGKFTCKDGVWVQQVEIPVCPDTNEPGAWANHFFADDFPLFAEETSKCLEFSNDRSMVAYNPASRESGYFPVAGWSDCVDDSKNQKFKLRINGQIVSKVDNKKLQCLSPLPINQNIHPNLDPCDTFNSHPNAGTWLFFIDCISDDDKEMDNTFQKFKYDKKKKTLISQCGHKFEIGKIGEGESEYGFITSGFEADGLQSLMFLTDMGLKDVGFN